jgi:hypothetical protein
MLGVRTNPPIDINNPITLGKRVIDRLNFFYTPSARDGYSHRILLRPMQGLAPQVYKELQDFAQKNVRQMLATACFNCRITYRCPVTGVEKVITTYEELSTAYVQNRDEGNFSKYVYAFNNFFKVNREWVRNLETRFMDDKHLEYSTTRSDSRRGNMTDVAYYITHLKHSMISNLQTKLNKSVTAEESLLNGGLLVSEYYI